MLWIEDLNAQWGVLGPKLAGPLREWLGQPTRYFVAVAYSEGPDALGSREFQALRLPVVVV